MKKTILIFLIVFFNLGFCFADAKYDNSVAFKTTLYKDQKVMEGIFYFHEGVFVTEQGQEIKVKMTKIIKRNESTLRAMKKDGFNISLSMSVEGRKNELTRFDFTY